MENPNTFEGGRISLTDIPSTHLTNTLDKYRTINTNYNKNINSKFIRFPHNYVQNPHKTPILEFTATRRNETIKDHDLWIRYQNANKHLELQHLAPYIQTVQAVTNSWVIDVQYGRDFALVSYNVLGRPTLHAFYHNNLFYEKYGNTYRRGNKPIEIVKKWF